MPTKVKVDFLPMKYRDSYARKKDEGKEYFATARHKMT